MNIVIYNTVINNDHEGRFNLNDLHVSSCTAKHYSPSFWIVKEQIRLVLDSDELSNNVIPIVYCPVGDVYAVKEMVYEYAMWINEIFYNHVVNVLDSIETELVKEVCYDKGETMTKHVDCENCIINELLLDALLEAIPFVEDALDDETYKKDNVRKTLNNIKKVISVVSNKLDQ